MALGSTQLLTEMSTRNILWSKGRSIAWKMWEPQNLTILWAFTACYRHSFTFYLKCPTYRFTDSPNSRACTVMLLLLAATCFIERILCFAEMPLIIPKVFRPLPFINNATLILV
jgi:hypothetical protein